MEIENRIFTFVLSLCGNLVWDLELEEKRRISSFHLSFSFSGFRTNKRCTQNIAEMLLGIFVRWKYSVGHQVCLLGVFSLFINFKQHIIQTIHSPLIWSGSIQWEVLINNYIMIYAQYL